MSLGRADGRETPSQPHQDAQTTILWGGQTRQIKAFRGRRPSRWGARRAPTAALRTVGPAGKLLHAKRPRLIPIFDRRRVAKALNQPRSHFWELIRYALRDFRIRQRLQGLQSGVSESSRLSLLRVLDIVVWMSCEPRESSWN